MEQIATPIAHVEEVSFVIVPEPGVSVYEAIRDAQLDGYLSIVVHADNTATVLVHKEH